MQYDFIIVGQGIVGTLLSYELLCAGKSVMLIDESDARAASRVASAVINPLVAKKWTIAQDAQVYADQALATYRSLEQYLGIRFLKSSAMFVSDVEENNPSAFQQQLLDKNPYLSASVPDELQAMFRQQFMGKLSPIYTINASALIQFWRAYIQSEGHLRAGRFHYDRLKQVLGYYEYEDIVAKSIVFCEGTRAKHNPYFPQLSFTANRGDVLLLSIPGLSTDYAYHLPFRLLAYHQSDMFWCGSNYIWNYENLEPDLAWRNHMEERLSASLHLPFEIAEHIVAERPTTPGQKIMFEQHAQYEKMFLLNGFGTRGFSAAPFWVKQILPQLGVL